MSKKIHTIVILRNGGFSTQFTASTVEEIYQFLPFSMRGYLADAIHYGQEKFYQGLTRYNLCYSYWDIQE